MAADAVRVRLHVIDSAHHFNLSTLVEALDSWVNYQLHANGSLLDEWLQKAGIDFTYIRYTIYHPASPLSAENVSSNAVQLLPRNISHQLGENMMIYWHHDTGINQGYCIQQTDVVSLHLMAESGPKTVHTCVNPTYQSINCQEYQEYVKKMTCQSYNVQKLQRNDQFTYTYTGSSIGLVSLSLAVKNGKVYESNTTSGEFTIPQDGNYIIKVQNVGNELLDVNFSYSFEKSCIHVNEFINKLLQSGYLGQKEVNVIWVDNPTELLHGHREYLTFPPQNATNVGSTIPTILFKKWSFIQDLLTGNSQSLWAYIAEAFGASIRTQGDFFVVHVKM